jgi:signal transduction histidine kinase
MTTPTPALAMIEAMSRTDRLFRAASTRLERVPRDAALALLVAVVQLCGTVAAAQGQPDRKGLDALAIALVLAGPASLAARRRAPLAVLGFATATALLYWGLDYPRGPVMLTPIVAFVLVVLSGHRAAAWASLVVAWVGFAWLPALTGHGDAPTLGKAIGLAVWLFLVAAGAEILRAKVEHHHEQERARLQEELARAGQERLRIARELHDVLAHNVSLINVQAGVALHLLDEQPERARPALEAIKEASSETLGEMRSVLSILRRPGEQPPRSPTVGIGGVEELVTRTAAAGIPVETEVSGEPRPVPASVDLAVYRIVQEALTNVARHARPTGATVRLAYGENAVTVEVDDAGVQRPGANGHGGGNGIAGMRERVAALGGEFAAGPRGGTGFRVRARLPLDGAP